MGLAWVFVGALLARLAAAIQPAGNNSECVSVNQTSGMNFFPLQTQVTNGSPNTADGMNVSIIS